MFILADKLNHERLFPPTMYNKRPALQNMGATGFRFDGDMYHILRLTWLVVDKKRMVNKSKSNDGDRINGTGEKALETMPRSCHYAPRY